MARYRTVSQLTTTDAAYIAGLIDGEGTIPLTQEHQNENRRLVISISNNELALLRYVQNACGTRTVTRKRTYSDRHTPSYAYKITNRTVTKSSKIRRTRFASVSFTISSRTRTPYPSANGPPIHIPLALLAAILSRIHSPVSSHSN